MNVLVAIFDICWLLAVLVFLFLIWRSVMRQTQSLEKTLIETIMNVSEAAIKAASAASALAEKIVQRKE